MLMPDAPSNTESLPTSVDLAEEYQASGVAEILDELDLELVGLKPVKQRIRETAALLLVEGPAVQWASAMSRHRCI